MKGRYCLCFYLADLWWCCYERVVERNFGKGKEDYFRLSSIVSIAGGGSKVEVQRAQRVLIDCHCDMGGLLLKIRLGSVMAKQDLID